MKNKQLIKSFSLYTFSNSFGAAAGLLLLPVLTEYLNPEEYGTLSLFNTYTQMLAPIMGLAASGLISVEYFNKNLSSNQFRSLFSSISIIPILSFIVVFLASLPFADFLSHAFSIPRYALLLLPAFGLLNIYYNQFLELLVIQKNVRFYTAINISKTTLELTLALIFVVLLGYGWAGRIVSTFMVLTFALMLAFYSVKKLGFLTFKINRDYIKQGLLYGLPLIGHIIGKFVINQSDKIFIANMVSKNELGIYNVGYLIGSTILIFVSAFFSVYTPYAFERLSVNNQKSKAEIIRMSYIFLITTVFVLLLVSWISKYIFQYILDKEYSDGYQYVFWTALSYTFWAGYLVFTVPINFLKKTNYLFYISIFNVFSNLILNYYLILRFGAIGAAYATVISFFFVFIITSIISQRLIKMPWLAFAQIIRFRKI